MCHVNRRACARVESGGGAMSRSRLPLSAVVLICAVVTPVTSASHPLRPRSQAAAAPVRHAAVHHGVQNRPVRAAVVQSRHDHRPAVSRPRAVVGYALPAVRVINIYPLIVPQPVAAVPVPYYVAAGAQPAEAVSVPSAGFPPNWNWRPVESFADLAPRTRSTAAPGEQQVRYYCPDTRDYFPAVETCDSSWLKVIP